jgi:hypothetical protein
MAETAALVLDVGGQKLACGVVDAEARCSQPGGGDMTGRRRHEGLWRTVLSLLDR